MFLLPHLRRQGRAEYNIWPPCRDSLSIYFPYLSHFPSTVPSSDLLVEIHKDSCLRKTCEFKFKYYILQVHVAYKYQELILYRPKDIISKQIPGTVTKQATVRDSHYPFRFFFSILPKLKIDRSSDCLTLFHRLCLLIWPYKQTTPSSSLCPTSPCPASRHRCY